MIVECSLLLNYWRHSQSPFCIVRLVPLGPMNVIRGLPNSMLSFGSTFIQLKDHKFRDQCERQLFSLLTCRCFPLQLS